MRKFLSTSDSNFAAGCKVSSETMEQYGEDTETDSLSSVSWVSGMEIVTIHEEVVSAKAETTIITPIIETDSSENKASGRR